MKVFACFIGLIAVASAGYLHGNLDHLPLGSASGGHLIDSRAHVLPVAHDNILIGGGHGLGLGASYGHGLSLGSSYGHGLGLGSSYGHGLGLGASYGHTLRTSVPIGHGFGHGLGHGLHGGAVIASPIIASPIVHTGAIVRSHYPVAHSGIYRSGSIHHGLPIAAGLGHIRSGYAHGYGHHGYGHHVY